MKKVLAVLLAVVLAFSVGTTAFAKDLIPEPGPTSGQVMISVKSDYIEAGNTYKFPVSIISSYTPTQVTGDTAVIIALTLGLGGSMSGAATIKGFEFSEALTSTAGFEVFEAYGNDLEPDTISFLVPGDELLNTNRTELGYIEVAIADNAVFENEDDALQITAIPTTFGMDYGYGGDLDTYIDSGKFGAACYEAAYAASVAVVDESGTVETLTYEDNLYTSAAVCYEKPPVIPWDERLITVLKTWGYKILNGIIAILNVALSFLNPDA